MGLRSLFAGAGIGAAFMYLMDPQRGRRRRGIARDKSSVLLRMASTWAYGTSRTACGGRLPMRDSECRREMCPIRRSRLACGRRSAVSCPIRAR